MAKENTRGNRNFVIISRKPISKSVLGGDVFLGFATAHLKKVVGNEGYASSDKIPSRAYSLVRKKGDDLIEQDFSKGIFRLFNDRDLGLSSRKIKPTRFHELTVKYGHPYLAYMNGLFVPAYKDVSGRAKVYGTDSSVKTTGQNIVIDLEEFNVLEKAMGGCEFPILDRDDDIEIACSGDAPHIWRTGIEDAEEDCEECEASTCHTHGEHPSSKFLVREDTPCIGHYGRR